MSETKTVAWRWKPRVVPPCSDCGTLKGRIDRGSVQPARRDGSKYGLGPLCLGCAKRHYARHRSQLEGKQPKLRESRLARQVERQAERIRRASRLLTVIDCRHGRPRYRFAKSCDLCGVGTTGIMFDGAEYELEGKICRQCDKELRDERAWVRYRELASVVLKGPSHDFHGPRQICLPVLTPGFTAEELTPKASCRLLVAQFDRRVTKVAESRRISA